MKFLSPNVKIKKTIVQPQAAGAPAIQTKVATDAYRNNFDAIFGTKRIGEPLANHWRTIGEPLANHSQNVSPIDD